VPNMGVWEVDAILLLVLAILVVGRLPEVGGAAGKRLRRFRRAPIDRRVARSPVAPVASAVVTGPPLPDAPVTAVVENKCPSCNTINPTGQVFCGQCGTRLDGAT
jgi:hypothetical protein